MLCVVILSVLGSNASAKTKMIDVVHLTDGSVVTGEIIEKTPNETIEIKTTDGGKLVTYPFDQIEKMDQVEVKFKSRTIATLFAAGPGSIGVPLLGLGQFYNGQQDKGLRFLALGATGILVALIGASGKPDDDVYMMTATIGLGMVLGGYIWSIVDANLSAKKINQLSNQKIDELKLKNYQSEDAPTSLNLNYIPHEGLMASYHFRF